jgi:hypothetical protein
VTPPDGDGLAGFAHRVERDHGTNDPPS